MTIPDIKLIRSGRPKGSLNEGRIRYRPKKWLPEFNQMVVDYIIIPGVTYEELGKKYGYSSVQVGNILRSPQALTIQEGMAKGIIKYNEDNLPVKLAEMGHKITQRLHDFLHDDTLYRADPFTFVDKSLAIGKGIGALNKETGDERGGTRINNTQINVAIGTEAARELGKSIELAKSLQVVPYER